MGKKRHNKSKFIAPIPVTLSSMVYGPLPELYPHNPLSWIYFTYKYLSLMYKPVPQNSIPDIKVEYEDNCFKVNDKCSMDRLWDYGFFGKGNLSRSDPSWSARTTRRLHLKEEGPFELSNEEITKLRREERTKFKNERAKEQELLIKKRKGEITEAEMEELQSIKDILIQFRKSNKLKMREEREQNIPIEDMRREDQLIVDKEKMKLFDNIEFMQLLNVEVFFLKFGLNLIEFLRPMDIFQLFLHCCKTNTPKPNNPFIIQYVIYHYYRSLGWCVRSGVKFGCDYILYKRGPPFSHAEYSILIFSTDGAFQKDWIQLQCISRVIGSVKKTLVLSYVDVPPIAKFNEVLFNENFNDEEKFIKLFHMYNINEVIYRRWIPNKTRD